MQKNRNCFFFFLLLIGISCQQASTTRTVVYSPPKPGDFKIIGYLPGRSVDTAVIAFRRLTHINFAFAIPAKNGGGLDALRNADNLAALVQKAHRHNVKFSYRLAAGVLATAGETIAAFTDWRRIPLREITSWPKPWNW